MLRPAAEDPVNAHVVAHTDEMDSLNAFGAGAHAYMIVTESATYVEAHVVIVPIAAAAPEPSASARGVPTGSVPTLAATVKTLDARVIVEYVDPTPST
jgi:hypothetical protein